MTTAPLLHSPEVRRTENRLLEVLQRERTTDPGVAAGPSIPAARGIHARPVLIEQAKGALMLHYGIDSHQAFTMLIGWARTSHTPVITIAHTLLRGISEGDPRTEVRQRGLMRWLEAQLRDSDPGVVRLQTAPDRSDPSHETPRSG